MILLTTQSIFIVHVCILLPWYSGYNLYSWCVTKIRPLATAGVFLPLPLYFSTVPCLLAAGFRWPTLCCAWVWRGLHGIYNAV